MRSVLPLYLLKSFRSDFFDHNFEFQTCLSRHKGCNRVMPSSHLLNLWLQVLPSFLFIQKGIQSIFLSSNQRQQDDANANQNIFFDPNVNDDGEDDDNQKLS